MKPVKVADDSGWPEPAPAGSKWRLGRVALVVSGLLMVAASGLWGLEKWLVGFPAHPTTVDRVEAMLRESTPVGCPRTQVLDWIKTSGFDPDYSANSGASGLAILAMIQDTSRSLVCRGGIQVEWDFDRSGELVKFEVRGAGACL